MKKQLNRHNPEEGVFGDCYRTCIANVLGVFPTAVPHFWTEECTTADEMHAKMNEWLHHSYG
ncbi:hypothetical protein KA005_16175, partial [bacterium]|nr:hypothetical protein [bacterium]